MITTRRHEVPISAGTARAPLLSLGMVSVLAAALAFMAAMGTARADVFTVPNIEVDASAPSATEAQMAARDEGRVRAFDRLLRRLTRTEDWPFLPDLTARELIDYEQSFQVNEEKRSGQRYLASITYSFRPSDVQGLLRRANIPFTETQAKPVLVLPVLMTDAGPELWTENPWLDAWNEANLTHELVPVTLPVADLLDLGTVSPEEAMDASWEMLAPLAARYNVSDILIAEADLRPDGTLQIEGRQMDADGEVQAFAADVRPETGVMATTPDEAAEAGLFAKAVPRVVAELQEDWKQATLIESTEERQVAATARFTGLDGWLAVRDGLQNAPNVTGLVLEALSTGGAELQIAFRGRPDQLGIALEQQDLYLVERMDYLEIGTGEPPEIDPLGYGEGLGAGPMGYEDPMAPRDAGPYGDRPGQDAGGYDDRPAYEDRSRGDGGDAGAAEEDPYEAWDRLRREQEAERERRERGDGLLPTGPQRD